MELVFSPCNETVTVPLKKPPLGVITGGGSAGVPDRLLIQAAITAVALVSTRLRANCGILVSGSVVLARRYSTERQTSFGVTTWALSAPRFPSTLALMMFWLVNGVS